MVSMQAAGELPQEVGTLLPVLESFSLFNNSLYGSIPSSLFNSSTLKLLELSYNEFSGSLPSDVGHLLVNLEVLRLDYNRLKGPIPSSITNASKLTILGITGNSFSGSIPYFGNLKFLERLLISENNLTGLAFLSSLSNCRHLQYLQVSENPLNGTLPASLGNFSSSFEFFEASNNNIMGVIPSEIGNLSSLLSLILIRNQLSGYIPPTIGEIRLLQMIYLSGNQLEGYLPNELCKMNNLGVLTLSDNMLVGPIPECLGDVKSLREIFLDSNQLSSTLPPNFWKLTDLVILNLSSNHLSGRLPYQLGNLKMMDSLDLSSNKFSGEIPGTIGDCQSLAFLNLSNNRFKGFIPNSLGSAKGLTTVDLSYNHMSGSIPNSLADLRFLEYFDVSNNELKGRIPNRGFFKNLTAQSFANNLALCGPVRFLVQPCPKDDGGSRGKKNVQLLKYMVLLLMLVVVTVIVMLVLIWRQKKKRVPVLSDDVSPLTIEWVRMRNRRRISYIELEQGTRSFSEANLLGRGNYGYVFIATLADGLKVAAKVFNFQQEGATESFDTEIEILGSIRHRNLVRLVGWCSYREFRALIVTYMPNGSLDEWLHSKMYALDLIQRLQIAIDVAAALEYLHHGYTSTIVHCNVKPSNVLLDQDMVAHLSDFGISKLFDGGEGIVYTQAPTTTGYAAPELETEGKVSTNGDVYSFGIMLLEIFTGKKPTENMFGEQMSLKEWASEALQRNAANEIVVPTLFSRQDQHYSAKEQCVSSVFELAIKCLAVSPHERINMIKAATTLHKIKETIVASTDRPRNRYAYPIRILSAY